MTLEFLVLMAGIFHFVLLPVSLSVPRVLDWKRELAGLTPLTRQIVWVHGAFIFGLIAAFGGLSIAMAGPLAGGSAQALAGLIGWFWFARLVVQLAYYDPRHWPKGLWVMAGRFALTALIAYWSGVYLIAWAAGFWV
jgi:hypothetical protein